MWWLIFIINKTRFWITVETDSGLCRPQRCFCFQEDLTEKRRSTLKVDSTIPWAGVSRLNQPTFISPYVLTVNLMWLSPSGSCHHVFSAMLDCHLILWAKTINWFFFTGIFLTATRIVNNPSLHVYVSSFSIAVKTSWPRHLRKQAFNSRLPYSFRGYMTWTSWQEAWRQEGMVLRSYIWHKTYICSSQMENPRQTKAWIHQSPIWWTNEFLLELFTGILNITFEELLRGTEMTQRQLYHQGPPQHAWQLTEPGGTWNTAHPQLNRLETVLSPVAQLV